MPQQYTSMSFYIWFRIKENEDEQLALSKIREKFYHDMENDYVRTNMIRQNIDENHFQTLSQRHESCAVITESPSIRPSEVTVSPSIHIPEGSSSLLFQIALKSNKNASELSICCRNQVLISMRQVLKKTINDIASKPIPKRIMYSSEKDISQPSLERSYINHGKTYLRNLQDDRSDEGAQLYAVILEDLIDQEGTHEKFMVILQYKDINLFKLCRSSKIVYKVQNVSRLKSTLSLIILITGMKQRTMN